jgi:hypothetical protein
MINQDHQNQHDISTDCFGGRCFYDLGGIFTYQTAWKAPAIHWGSPIGLDPRNRAHAVGIGIDGGEETSCTSDGREGYSGGQAVDPEEASDVARRYVKMENRIKKNLVDAGENGGARVSAFGSGLWPFVHSHRVR